MIWNAYSEEKERAFGISVKSCGHIFAKPGRRVYRPCGRADWLLFYVYKGSETFILNGKTEVAKEGSFIIFKPFEEQNHFYDGERTAEFYFVHFNLENEESLVGLKSSTVYYAEPSIKVCEIFEYILAELQLKQTSYERICIARLAELFGILRRRTEKSYLAQSEEFGKIAFVVQHIHKNFNSDESLEALADMCSLSKFHFLRKFEEITGMTPIAYKNKLRISHAKEMLEDTSLTVNEVAEAIGYSSASYFCDAFKKETGVSPSKYRKSKIG